MIQDLLKRRATARANSVADAIRTLEDTIRRPPPPQAPQGYPSGAGIWVVVRVHPEDRGTQETRRQRSRELHAQSIQTQRLLAALSVGDDPSQPGQQLAFRRAKVPQALLTRDELEAASEAASLEPNGEPVRVVTAPTCWLVFKPEPGGWSLFSIPRNSPFRYWREALSYRPVRPSSTHPPTEGGRP